LTESRSSCQFFVIVWLISALMKAFTISAAAVANVIVLFNVCDATSFLSHDLGLSFSYSAPSFGDPKCPCIGFDNVEGQTTASVDGRHVAYPADLGSSCEAWDGPSHPKCKSGAPPDWCSQKWCYVNPTECDIPTMSKQSVYQPGATQQGMPVHYSYVTCGGTDSYAKKVPRVGIMGCRCIGFDIVCVFLLILIGTVIL